MTEDNSILLIGVGNAFRSDDGLGIYVVRELRHHLPNSIRIIEMSGEGTSLMAAWRDAKHVLLIDAICSGEPEGSKPDGTVHRVNAIEERIPKQMFNSSSHTFGVGEAIELARQLNQLPTTLVLYGIEAESFETGAGLSESVVRSVPDLLHTIEHDIERLTKGNEARLQVT